MISLIAFLAGFINTSIIPGVPLPLVFWAIVPMLAFRASYRPLYVFFRKADFYFVFFGVVAFLSVITSSYKSVLLITQLVNISIFYFFYYLALLLFKRKVFSYDSIYRGVNYFLFFNFIIHFIGFLNSALGRQIIVYFNNSSSYSLGGIFLVTGEFLTRAGGVLPEPSYLSAICTISIGLFFIVEKNKLNVFMFFSALFLLFVSQGRTGIAALVIFFLLYPFLRSKKIFALSVLTFLLAGSIFTMYSIDYLMGIDESFRQRFSAINYAIQGFKQRPFLGNGLGAFQEYSKARLLDFRDIFFWPLNLLFSSGILGLMLFSMFVIKNFNFSDKTSRTIFLIYFSVSVMLPSYNFYLLWFVLAAERLRCNYVHNS